MRYNTIWRNGLKQGKFWVWQMGQTSQPRCPQCCSKLFFYQFHSIFGLSGLFFSSSSFLTTFGACEPIFEHFQLAKAQHGLVECLLLCLNFIPHLTTQNRPSRPIFFGLFLAPLVILVQVNVPNQSAWMSSVLFQPFPILFKFWPCFGVCFEK